MSYLTFPPEYLDYLPDLQKTANVLITFTPLLSYGTTCYGIYKNKSSMGFSIDICGTMFFASILRILYYFVTPYEPSLLRQSIVMIFIQSILLKTSLHFRPKGYGVDQLQPTPGIGGELSAHYNNLSYMNVSTMTIPNVLLNYYSFVKNCFLLVFGRILKLFDVHYARPHYFWQWEDELSYWKLLGQFTAIFAMLTALFNSSQFYGSCIGTLGLFIESLLPLPQILLLNRLKSIKNFKVVLLLSWLGGDCTKISYLIYGTDNVSAIFILAALFQMGLDIFIAFQYFYFRSLEMDDKLGEAV